MKILSFVVELECSTCMPQHHLRGQVWNTTTEDWVPCPACKGTGITLGKVTFEDFAKLIKDVTELPR